MSRRQFSLISSLFFLSIIFLSPVSHAAKVETSIAPIHSVVSYLLDGIDQPGLLIDKATSPHDFALKPSHRLRLKRAKLIIWGGESLETSLALPIKKITRKKDLALLDNRKLDLLGFRTQNHWLPAVAQSSAITYSASQESSSDKHSNKHKHDHSLHSQLYKDPHFWLDPRRVSTAAEIIHQQLQAVYPKQSLQLKSNLAAFNRQLEVLDQNLRNKLYPVQKTPFLVFHDAWQYFDHRYQLNPAGALTNNPEQPLKLRTIHLLKQRIRNQNIHCLFSEPQFPTKSVQTLARLTDIKVALLDPLGSQLAPGKQLYFQMMNKIGDVMRQCLIHS
ncbi:zinc ABC transporter substrate-binding protein [Pelagibaculum spongiae]|uniref:High-affinity zinc uptake system protein ZnuA n=1 Tax=Pelagibaculum spongiae TaxID=2080658 RepID=A0A2V1H3P1_9GAMM|nr:zinc ABC transporter substrate-binding protein [Pelagibaculum spongiae]PVZ70256.1 hypothetical protein DC094_06560 [Pelagibaculum spongiae]